jgi:hypothetical protein
MSRKLADDEAKKSSLNVRVLPDLRAKLEAAASDAGRSLTQEAEDRLERSFDPVTSTLLGLTKGDTKPSRVIRALANVFYAVSFEESGAPAYIAREGLGAAFAVILADVFPDPGGLMSDIFNTPDEGAKERARKNFSALAEAILAAHRAKRYGENQNATLDLVQRAQVLGFLPADYDEAITALQAAQKTAKSKKMETAD